MSARLKQLEPALRTQGFEIDSGFTGRDVEKRRSITIRKPDRDDSSGARIT